MSFHFTPAKREKVSLLIALAGASGSGKTKSALRLAQGISPDGKIAFMDTEARRGLHYADDHKFWHADMRPPFRPERFLEGIHAAEAAGAEVVIIDSFSNEYDGEGGIMDWADELAEGKPKAGIEHPRHKHDSEDWWKDWAIKPVDSPGNWKEPKLAHKKMMNAILQCRASLIFCLRAEEKIEIKRGDRGKTVVNALGWMPVCEKRFMFDMTVSFTLTPGDQRGRVRYDLPHKAYGQHQAIFPDGSVFDEQMGRRMADWARGDHSDYADIAKLIADGDERADRGMAALEHFWNGLKPEERRAVGGKTKIDAWKEIARQADAAFDDDDFGSSEPERMGA